MNRYPPTNATTNASEWLMETIRRNPEGLLLAAAGCALLMRSGSSAPARQSESRDFEGRDTRFQDGGRSHLAEGASRVAQGASDYASGLSDYASGIKDRVADTASSYASTVSNYASEAGSNIARQSGEISKQAQSTVQSGMQQMLREQPLAVAVLGVAAGAALAAIFPTTEVEGRVMGSAKEALTEAAGKVGENLMEAAGAAGERLKTMADEKGLNPEGLKDAVRDVAGTFASSVSGKADEEPTLVPSERPAQLGATPAPRPQNQTSGMASTGRRDGL
jgi:X-X-X-Leu-X-X-Gly heptad repeat protein